MEIKTVTKNNNTMEVETMVRRAKELKSLDELNLSNRTMSYLKKNFGSIDDIIKTGRNIFYDCGIVVSPKWQSELTSAIKEAGFVRPEEDFRMSFSVARLYMALFPNIKENFVVSVGQLSNKQYEEFRPVTDEQIRQLKVFLKNCLSERKYEILISRFGLEDGVAKDLESVGRQYNVTRERIRQTEAKALRILGCHIAELPRIFDASDSMNEAVDKLGKELEALYETPEFVRAREIVTELERMERLPFKYACKYFDGGGVTGYTPLEDLELSPRAFNCLKHAGINTVSDVLNYPEDEWLKIRNLGRHALEEVIEKMHSLGYGDFNVETTPYRWPIG